jgi:hypothetical protein
LIIDITLGFIVSAIVAFFVVKWLLRFVISHTFNSFAIYRVILGVALLAALATHTLSDTGEGTKDETSAPAVVPSQPAMPSAPDTNAPIPTLAPASTPTTNTDSSSSAPAPTNPAPANVPAPQ